MHAQLSADGRARRLYDGNWMPMLGFGVRGIPDGPACEQAVQWALESGYRHIDAAQRCCNEQSVGRALRHSGLPREEVFLTTKFANAYGDPLRELDRSLAALGVEYVDLYLIAGAACDSGRAWAAMQQAYEGGQARSIGISDFASHDLAALLLCAEIQPAVNQVGFNPHERDASLLETCIEAGVVLESRSPLGEDGRELTEPAVGRIAQRLGRTPAQVLLRWCIDLCLPVVINSTRRERIRSNSLVFDFELSLSDRCVLDQLDDRVAPATAPDFRRLSLVP